MTQAALVERGYRAGKAGKPCNAPVKREIDRAAWEQGWRSGAKEHLQAAIIELELKKRRELRERLTDNALVPTTHYLAEINRATGEEKILFGGGDVDELYAERDERDVDAASNHPDLWHAVRAI